ncbi:MAG: hypothetical protein HRT69_03565 [Flavobacteriaceae bacterium]|nr:hypothetical protein [Flavobacteriaceae bacterium]
MDLKKIYNNRNEIINGHINELKTMAGLASKTEKNIFTLRENICNECPIKVNNSCDAGRWIHPKTLDVVTTSIDGYIRGCGCRLSAKQKSKDSLCPAGFWGGEF